MKKQSKILIIIVGGILLAVTIAITAVLLVSGRDGRKYQKHMEAAQQYLDELQYEQAIAEFELAIEIEPNNIEAYQALAELYVQMEDYESAIAVLNRGIEQTDSKRLSHYMEEVQADQEEKQVQMVQEQLVQEQLVQEQPEQEQMEVSQEETTEELRESAENNIPREETVYMDDGSYRIDEYDVAGNCVKMNYYDVDRKLQSYTIFEYDENGNLVKEYCYDAVETLQSYIIHKYGANGKRVKSSYYDADGTKTSFDEYDVHGNCIKNSSFNADWTPISCDEYDEHGNCVKMSYYYANGLIRGYSTYEYDADGNYVKMITYDAFGLILFEAGVGDSWYWIDEYVGSGNAVIRYYYNDYYSVDRLIHGLISYETDSGTWFDFFGERYGEAGREHYSVINFNKPDINIITNIDGEDMITTVMCNDYLIESYGYGYDEHGNCVGYSYYNYMSDDGM